MSKINKSVKELMEIYNEMGHKMFKEYLKNEFGISDPYYYIKKLRKEFQYSQETDKFETKDFSNENEIFLGINELCTKGQTRSVISKKNTQTIDDLVKQLLEERLLQLNNYVHLDQNEREVHIDKTSMIGDRYKVVIY